MGGFFGARKLDRDLADGAFKRAQRLDALAIGSLFLKQAHAIRQIGVAAGAGVRALQTLQPLDRAAKAA